MAFGHKQWIGTERSLITVFEQDGIALHARNMPSLGATSLFDIGEMIANRALE